MESFPTIKGAKLTPSIVKNIKNYFKWSAFTVGKTKMNITPTGGVHSSGKLTMTEAVMFEIIRFGTYIVVALYEYPGGVIFHSHISWVSIDKKNINDWKVVIEKVYNEVKTILLKE